MGARGRVMEHTEENQLVENILWESGGEYWNILRRINLWRAYFGSQGESNGTYSLESSCGEHTVRVRGRAMEHTQDNQLCEKTHYI